MPRAESSPTTTMPSVIDHRDDRPVDEQQHDGDDGERQPLDHLHAGVADGVLIRRRRRRTRHVGLDPGRRLDAVDDVANGLAPTRWPAPRPGRRRCTPARRRLCRRCSGRRPRSACRPRSPGRAARAWCRRAARGPSRRRTRARPAPSGSSPSSTIITELLVSYSSNTSPTRLVAISAGASLGLIDTARSLPTSSSCGTVVLRSATIAIQTRTIGMAKVRMNRGSQGRAA